MEAVHERSCLNWLRIWVTDPGCGFDPAQTDDRSGGIGGMRERAALVGGRLTLRSRPGRGIQVLAELPTAPSLEAARR